MYGELLSEADPVVSRVLVSEQLLFPELRLIEYDCGKFWNLILSKFFGFFVFFFVGVE